MSGEIVIVGGGAAGLMAAGTACRRGRPVTLIDCNATLARKVRITGKGRCNVTNDCDADRLMAAMRTNGRFLYSAFSRFAPADTIRFFEGMGVPLKTERGGRVFPLSDRAEDIAEALVCWAEDAEVLEGRVTALLPGENGGIGGVRLEDGREIGCERLLLATGGMSYPGTGSRGDGYRLAGMAGHTIVPPRASLVPVETSDGYTGALQGLSLRNVTLTLTGPDRKGRERVLFSELGEMLFTHFGVSGPLVLRATTLMEEPAGRYRMAVDLKPALDREKLDSRILRDFERYRNRDFLNALGELLPRKLIPVAIALAGIDPHTKVHQITRAERAALVEVIKAFPVTPSRLRPIAEAIVTAGGVDVREVDPRTMASKICPGLFFAGELLDVDGVTGGFNLQIAFSTGHLAGEYL